MDYDRMIDCIERDFGIISKRISQQRLETSRGEAFMLQTLSREAMSPAELARELNVSMPRIAAILNGLEKKDFAHRHFDTADRRRVIAVITESGRTAAENNKRRLTAAIKNMLVRIGDEDAKNFVRIIGKIADGIESDFYSINT